MQRITDLVTNAGLARQFTDARLQTEAICAPLEIEDYVIQPVVDVSPPKWHLAHTTWFWEQFVLGGFSSYQPYDHRFAFLFNSYYIQAGEFHPRRERGELTRPTVAEVYRYRASVTAAMQDLINKASRADLERMAPVVLLGINHEQQHQELLVTDIKRILWGNPTEPVYQAREESIESSPVTRLEWLAINGGLKNIGYGGGGFAFDNEGPLHQAYLRDYLIADRLVTNREYLEFIEDGGYRRSEFWLSDGWDTVRAQGWQAPMYWEKRDGEWWSFTLAGMKPVDLDEPVCHISHYEADAFAAWAGKRLPTEFEWEVAATDTPIRGNFADSGRFHPVPGTAPGFLGNAWQWTSSAYLPYPGFHADAGALGEYNGKFMSGQMVLRGGSCATPASHIRPTYRNFFQPYHRWQFSGIRLAADA